MCLDSVEEVSRRCLLCCHGGVGQQWSGSRRVRLSCSESGTGRWVPLKPCGEAAVEAVMESGSLLRQRRVCC